MTRQERIELHDRLVVMLDGVRKELMSRFPEVVSVDLGLKERHGSLTEEFSWRVFVKEKRNDLRPEEMIPREVAGLPTDVQQLQVDRLKAENDDSSYSTLSGGIQITGAGGIGTLGCFVTLGADTKVHLLSNYHVLMADSSSVGALIGQPDAACDLCCCKCCDVAVVVNGVQGTSGGPLNNVDAAVALLRGQTPGDTKVVPYSNSILEIGPIYGSGTVAVNDIVRKRGRTTGLTTGKVVSITASYPVVLDSSTTVTFTDLIDINPHGTSTSWIKGGDSGSAVINASGQVVGLNMSGNDVSGRACKIANISTRLGGITVLSTGTTGTVPNSSYGLMEASIATANPANFLRKIEDKLKQTEGGRQLLQVVREHRTEVIDLINDNREVKVAWNRFQGPAYVGHMAKNVTEPSHAIPSEIDGHTMQNLIIKMSDVLERNGSRKLADAVDQYSIMAIQFADQYNGFDTIDQLIERGLACPKCGNLKNQNPYA